MSGVDGSDTPPEVPEEYAAVYRDAYRRALEEDADPALDPVGAEELPEFPDADPERPRWLVPVVAAAVALALVAGAYGVGRLVSGDDEPSGPGVGAPEVTRTPPPRRPSEPAGESPDETPAATSSAAADAYQGEVAPVAVDDVSATCTSRPGVDAAGDPVRYVAANTVDGEPETAWRCDGRAVGTTLTLTLPAGTDVAEVGLVPGYAKTDPASGADRYAENNRITRVRWTFDDGTSVEQRLDPDPELRALQTLRVPETASGSVTLEILDVRRGPRNTTAISEIAIAAAAP